MSCIVTLSHGSSVHRRFCGFFFKKNNVSHLNYMNARQEKNLADKRYFPRWEVQNRVLYQAGRSSSFREAVTRDLSCAGACLCTQEAVGPEQKIKLTVFLSEETKVELLGKVVWIQFQEDKNLIGVNFFNTEKEAQDLILEHAFSLNRKKLIDHWYQGWNNPSR